MSNRYFEITIGCNILITDLQPRNLSTIDAKRNSVLRTRNHHVVAPIATLRALQSFSQLSGAAPNKLFPQVPGHLQSILTAKYRFVLKHKFTVATRKLCSTTKTTVTQFNYLSCITLLTSILAQSKIPRILFR